MKNLMTLFLSIMVSCKIPNSNNNPKPIAFELAGISFVSIDNPFGSLTIHGEPSRTTLEIISTFSGNQENFDQIKVTAVLDTNQADTGIEIFTESVTAIEDVRIDIEIFLPEKITLSNLTIEVDSIGELFIENVELDETVQFAEASLDTRTTPVTAKNLKGLFTFSTAFSSVATLGTLSELATTVDPLTGDSFIAIEMETFGIEGGIEISVDNGGVVDASIPLTEGALLETQSPLGSVSLDPQFSFVGTTTPTAINGTIGSGTPHIVFIEANNATITIAPF